ncbi:MAG: CHAT domain-containing protein, partial [Phycisphaerales bacterium]|nr:CHAT domain-containing protein [Phycisphaerales bacterium]
RSAEATADLENAAAIFDELGHGTARARVDLILGEQAARAGDFGAATALLEGALAALADQPSGSASARFHLANVAIEQGDLDGADRLLAEAIASVAALGIPTLMADLLHAQGRIRRLRGEVTAAIDRYRGALELVEQVRGSFRADRLRAAFLGDRVALYEDLVGALLERGGSNAAAEAFAVVERAKSRSLLELIRGAVENFTSGLADADDPEIRSLAAEAARLQAELNALYSRLAGEGEQDQRVVADLAWQDRVRQHERELSRIEHRLAATEPGAMALAVPADVEAVQSALDAETILVEYFLAGRELMAWIVDRHSVRLVRSVSDHARVADRVSRLRFQIGKALRPGALAGPRAARLLEDARLELMALHEAIAAPVLSAMGADSSAVRRLIVVPHGPLHLVPFHALREGRTASSGVDLIDRFEIAVCPSAGVFVHAARRPASARAQGAAVIGVGDAAAPLIPAEARSVARRLGADRVFIGDEATVERVTAGIGDARILHFACHGRFSPTSPLSSGLLMADRWLTVRDIARLRLQADLVTLSGCETGCNLVSDGDELLGLLRGFLSANAGAVLASLWTTSDSSTAALMDHFYHGLLGGPNGSSLRPSEALRAAQLALRAERPHPVLWAPFIITGAS